MFRLAHRVFASTVVSHIADQAVLKISKAIITNVTDAGLTVALTGALSEASRAFTLCLLYLFSRSSYPISSKAFDAQFVFVEPVDIYWNGERIANVALPELCSTGNLGIPYVSVQS